MKDPGFDPQHKNRKERNPNLLAAQKQKAFPCSALITCGIGVSLETTCGVEGAQRWHENMCDRELVTNSNVHKLRGLGWLLSPSESVSSLRKETLRIILVKHLAQGLLYSKDLVNG